MPLPGPPLGPPLGPPSGPSPPPPLGPPPGFPRMPRQTPYRTPPLMEDIEDVQKYVVGGYHPVAIGDVLGDSDGIKRFRVIHKLGAGGFSTVWWTRSSVDQRYYALKVMCSSASFHDRELEVMSHFPQQREKLPNITSLLDSFEVIGQNGTHLCLVYPLLGPSLKKVWKQLANTTRHRVCKELTSGLAFLHDHEVCHGDLTPSNVLFELQDVQNWTETEISQMFGEPKTAELRLHDGSYSTHSPIEVVQAIEFTVNETMLGPVRIIDFGQSFNSDNPPTGLGIPLPYFPPEVCFGYPPSKMSDVWSLACIIFEVQTWRLLAPMMFKSFKLLLGTLRFTLGTFPEAWRDRYSDKYASDILNGKGAPKIWFDEEVPLEWPIVSLIHERASHLSPDKREQLLHLIRAMLVYEPWQRLTARGVLEHVWMRETI
ncbi:kinase-like domain-containing protein [Mariannaea sp. PMI_226]|nr:kinase-like domain-containing protein [Mariannaea sp. PMI_226]